MGSAVELSDANESAWPEVAGLAIGKSDLAPITTGVISERERSSAAPVETPIYGPMAWNLEDRQHMDSLVPKVVDGTACVDVPRAIEPGSPNVDVSDGLKTLDVERVGLEKVEILVDVAVDGDSLVTELVHDDLAARSWGDEAFFDSSVPDTERVGRAT
jgi:hypothetical protein